MRSTLHETKGMVEEWRDIRTGEDDKKDASRVFIPCPVCRAPIELPVGELPERIVCPNCQTVLER
jgi:LSD1 subclass zinc finger protein